MGPASTKSQVQKLTYKCVTKIIVVPVGGNAGNFIAVTMNLSNEETQDIIQDSEHPLQFESPRDNPPTLPNEQAPQPRGGTGASTITQLRMPQASRSTARVSTRSTVKVLEAETTMRWSLLWIAHSPRGGDSSSLKKNPLWPSKNYTQCSSPFCSIFFDFFSYKSRYEWKID